MCITKEISVIKILSVLMLFSSISIHAASVRITVDINGTPKEGLVYFNYSTNSYNGMDYIHLDNLRVRVGREGFNVAAKSDIDTHICQLLGYSYSDYRIVGGGGYDNASANIARLNGRNVIAPLDLSLDMITCARPL